MRIVWIKVRGYWIALEAGAPKSNPALEVGLGIILFGCLLVAMVMS